MNTPSITIAEKVLADRIAKHDAIMADRKAHPSEAINSWMGLITWGEVTYPRLTRSQVTEIIRAAFPQFNTRWSS